MPDRLSILQRGLCLPRFARMPVLAVLLLAVTVMRSAQAQELLQEPRHSPTKATLLSTVLPGAGQFYNKKYWKIPVLYGAFAGLGYLVKFNDDRFQTYKEAYIRRTDENPETVDDFTDTYTDGDLKALRDFYRRNRDLSFVFAGLVYVLNIVDASVDAHLYHFDISDDLSLHVVPVAGPAFLDAPSAGLQVTLQF